MAILNNCNVKDTLMIASTDKQETYNVAEYLEGLQSFSHCIYHHKCASGEVYRMGNLCWFHNDVMITALPQNTMWQVIPEGYRPMKDVTSTDSLISSNVYMGTLFEQICTNGKFYLVTDKPNTTVEVHIDLCYITQNDWPDSADIIESTKGHVIPNDIDRTSLINAMKWKLIGTATDMVNNHPQVSIPTDDIIINELMVIITPVPDGIKGSYTYNIPYNHLNSVGENFKQGAYYSAIYYSECVIFVATDRVVAYSLTLTNGDATMIQPNVTLSVYYR